MWTPRPPRVARPRLLTSSRRFREAAPCTIGAVSVWLPSNRADCRPRASMSGGRSPAGARLAPQNRSRRPASQRTSLDSEPSVEGIYRLIDGRDRGARVHRGDSLLALFDFLTSCFASSSGTPHDDDIPVDLTLPPDARAPSGMALDDPCEGSGTAARRYLCRVADEPGGVGPKPFASLSLPLALTTTP